MQHFFFMQYNRQTDSFIHYNNTCLKLRGQIRQSHHVSLCCVSVCAQRSTAAFARVGAIE